MTTPWHHGLLAAGETAVKVVGEFTWDLHAPASLVGIDMQVEAGSFVAIVGATGRIIIKQLVL